MIAFRDERNVCKESDERAQIPYYIRLADTTRIKFSSSNILRQMYDISYSTYRYRIL